MSPVADFQTIKVLDPPDVSFDTLLPSLEDDEESVLPESEFPEFPDTVELSAVALAFVLTDSFEVALSLLDVEAWL